MTKLSKYQVNLKGKVPIIIYGLYFRDDITACLFDSETAPVSNKNERSVQCMT
jgi:hypothetical protein